MYGLPSGIDGGHSRRGDHHHAFVGLCLQVPQKSGLAGARSSRKEDVRIGI